MSNDRKSMDRRTFLQLTGATTLAGLKANIAKALAIPANDKTHSIKDVEHVVVLMQENRPFDHHFGTLRGVRGYSDPRAVKINLPLKNGTGTTPVSVFLQPAGAANMGAGFSVPPNSGNLGGPSDGADVVPPFRVNPASVSPTLKNIGGTYLPGTGHGWSDIHNCWNHGQYDQWAVVHGPLAMNYMIREDVPYHNALADAFTVGDAYYCSIMGPTNPNRYYMWAGCIGNLSNLGPGGADGHGSGPATFNGLSKNKAYWTFPTFPEVLQTAGVTWKIYQDLAGQTFAPDFGDGTGNSFAGNFTDNSVLYSNQYATAPTTSPLFQNGCTGTSIINLIPPAGAPADAWLAWAEHLFDNFRNDVKNGTLPQVSWVVAPAGYTEHSDWPINYGAWYMSHIFDILVSNPDVFSKTVFLINYDEADGSFDHLVPPSPPYPNDPAHGASTVDTTLEIVTNDPSGVNGPIGLGQRVPFLAISPWSKGGYVSSQVFDHTSVIQFIEKCFGVFEPNISPWRRAVSGDLTSIFDFQHPNADPVQLPSTVSFLPSPAELAGTDGTTFHPTLSGVMIGVPAQEKGIRPARALPYELDVRAAVNASSHTVVLTFINTGTATAVFHVRSGNPADPVRYYTVEPGKQLTGSWSAGSTYDLSVYGPNGFARYFKGSVSSSAAALDVFSQYLKEGHGAIDLNITNVGANRAEVSVMDAYTGDSSQRFLQPRQTLEAKSVLNQTSGWYDWIITVAGDPTFEYRLAGHVETGKDSTSDPALGGLTLKGL
jgi:phospholipase C